MLTDPQKIWSILTPTERRKALWALLLMALIAVVETASVVSIMPFLSVLSRPGIVQENGRLSALYAHLDFDSTSQFIAALGLVSIALVVGAATFKAVGHHLLNRVVQLQRHAISSRLLSRYLRQPYEFFLSRNSSELGKNILSETDQLLFNLIQPFAQLLAHAVVVLAISTLIIWHDPWMALWILLTIGLLYAAIYGLVKKRLEETGKERHTANSQRYQACNEALGGIKDVQITHSADAYLDKFNKASRLLSRHQATNDTLSQTPLYLVEAAGYTGLIAIALILLFRTNDAAHVLPTLGLYGFAAYRLLPAAQSMYRGVARLKFSSTVLDRIYSDLLLPDEPLHPASSILAPSKQIRLEKIQYAYPATPDALVFEDFDLTIPANTSIGIAGRSGAGKSTLMDLLLGLLRPQKGALYIDDTRIDASNVQGWQQAIGYVPQHIYLADASVSENIAFGVAPANIDTAAVERAARAAQLHEFICRDLPDGYRTAVGERGIRLSGGQRQRIGIARALYRDPPVLFFDEATSALDAQTETELNEAIRCLSGSKTIIVIAHKETSLAACGTVVFLPSRPPRPTA